MMRQVIEISHRLSFYKLPSNSVGARIRADAWLNDESEQLDAEEDIFEGLATFEIECL